MQSYSEAWLRNELLAELTIERRRKNNNNNNNNLTEMGITSALAALCLSLAQSAFSFPPDYHYVRIINLNWYQMTHIMIYHQ